ncbi:hypothetical protein [Halorubrum kocurii]|nr:hypothetical protein [Halorubrum kocurii]
MTNSVPGPTDDRTSSPPDRCEHRQHASADVAPELFAHRPERR